MTSIEDDIDELPDQTNGRSQYRMVDWLQSWRAPLMCGGIVAILGMFYFQGNGKAIDRMFLVGGLFAIWTLGVQLRGLYFDKAADSLSYPFYFFRRSISLSRLKDANCQVKYGENDPLSIIFGLIGLKTESSSKTKRYLVNLSGDFGARRVIFHDKYKRDQFLSLIRSFAPQTRITRWS